MAKRRKIERLLEARQVNVLDEQDRVRIVLSGGGETHGPNISLLDASGRQRVAISLDRHGFPVVACLNHSGSTGVGLGINADGSGMSMRMPDGESWITIGFDPDGEPHLEAFDSEGKSRWRAP